MTNVAVKPAGPQLTVTPSPGGAKWNCPPFDVTGSQWSLTSGASLLAPGLSRLFLVVYTIHSQYFSLLNVYRPMVDSDPIVPSGFLTNRLRLNRPSNMLYSATISG